MAWKLVRQDTHGTRFDVATYDSKDDAEKAMAAYEAGYPHHQTYYVESHIASGNQHNRAAEIVERVVGSSPPPGTARTVWSPSADVTSVSWAIDETASDSLFSERFGHIREQLVRLLQTLHSECGKPQFLASDHNGEMMNWVWDDELFSNAHSVGTVDDASAFVRNMVNQGMYFSFMFAAAASESYEVAAIWLTTYEGDDLPIWPEHTRSLLQIDHLGIRRAAIGRA